jgi:6,7-dimethyl-8-ribityllumazine synthase
VADDVKATDRVQPDLDGGGLRIGLAASRFNDHVTRRLLDGARRGLAAAGVADADVSEVWVPGAFELPVAAHALVLGGHVDAVVCVGCVIRGETFHFELVAEQCASGIQHVSLTTGVPVLFGVVTVDTLEQALERSEPAGGHNVGEEAAQGAIEMARLVARLNPVR